MPALRGPSRPHRLVALLVAASLGACRTSPPTPQPSTTPAAPRADADASPADVPPAPDASVAPSDAPVPATDAPAATAQAAAPTPPASPMFRGRPEDEWLQAMATRPVVRTLERYSSTLEVFHLDLGDGVEVSFQPELVHLETFWRREITSYHLSRLLGIRDRVPPTVGRRVPVSAFGRHGHGVAFVADREGMVYGSASVWMPVLNRVHMNTPEAHRAVRRLVNPVHPIPEGQSERARQVAEVLVFDYLAANYDRWNCCNITSDEHGDLVFRDNDAGWEPSVINRVSTPTFIGRVPRYLYESIQRVTPEVLRASVETDPTARDVRLVRPGAYEGYERRRQALLQQLRDAIARHGESTVLAWP